LIETEAPSQEPRIALTGRASAALALSTVGKEFHARSGLVRALDGLSFACAEREVLGVVGPSGCGKSTLLELICGLDQPTEGTVAVGGATAARDRLARCVLMPQRDLLLPWRSAIANAALPLELSGLRRAEARRQVAPLMERFGLAGFARARPAELSGGMRQRVAFLRTLVAGKPNLLLDEPFGSLDSITRAAMQEWLADTLIDEPRTVVLVSHDVEEALFLCDRVIVLSERPGRVRTELVVSIPRPRPRSATVTSPEFTALKEQALEALS
jgi:ABC-type nitrate/sulfonate/bicarbonate transport system ATPase subunit